MSHTPQPWVSHDDDYCPEEIYGNLEGPMEDGKVHGTLICTIANGLDEWTGEPEANRLLIKAAPDLLAACESMLATCGSSADWQGETHQSLLLIEAALQKAKGQ